MPILKSSYAVDKVMYAVRTNQVRTAASMVHVKGYRALVALHLLRTSVRNMSFDMTCIC
jgi:hypothetical protein